MTQAMVQGDCHRPGCPTELPDGFLFACRPHWFELPNAIANRISRTWRIRRANPGDAEAVHRHEAAKQSAIDWWAERDAAKAAGDG